MATLDIEIDANSTILENTLANNDKKYLYIAKAPPIANVVFSGGGAKGVVYPGVIKALEGQAIKNVAGSSIGAITAALYASGMSGDDFKDITRQQDFKGLLGSLNSHLHKTGEPLLNFLREQIPNSILQVLKSADIAQFSDQYNKLEAKQKAAIHTLLQDPQQEKNIGDLLDQVKKGEIKITQPVTFSMLAALREFNATPGIDGAFKDLSITAVGKETGELYIFNAENTENLEIALASRASASLPVILEPVEIPQKYLGKYAQGDKPLHFVDGGFLDNIPVSTVDPKQKKELGVNLGEQGQNLQTLAFVFDETTKNPYGPGFQSPYLNTDPFNDKELYEPGFLEKVIRNVVPRILGGVKTKIKNTEAKARGLKLISTDFTQRNIPLLVAGIGSSDFNQAKEKSDALMKMSEEATKEYLNNHDNEAVYLTFNNPTSLFLAMPIQKLQALIDNKKEVFGVAASDLAEIKNFRVQVDSIISKSNEASVLKNLSQFISREAKLNETSPQSYYDYITDQLHSDKKTWNEIIKKKSQPSNLDTSFSNSLQKRDAQDKLLAKQRELVGWISQELNAQQSKLSDMAKKGESKDPGAAAANKKIAEGNIELLNKAKEDIISAATFQSLSNAIAPVKNNFHDEAKKLSMLSLLRKSTTLAKAEKYSTSLDESSLNFDSRLTAEKSQEKVDISQPDNEKVASLKNKRAAVIDIDSLVKPEDARNIINNLKEKGVTDIYFIAPIHPNSLSEDIKLANEGRANDVKSPEPVIKVFQRVGFNVTVITPLDSESADIKMGSTYKDGMQPYYDKAVTGRIGITSQEDKATVRALSVIAYENTLRSNLNNQERNEASITGLMQKKFIENIPGNINSVIYIGKTENTPALFVSLNDVSVHTIKADTDANSLQHQFDTLSLPALPQEMKIAVNQHFNQNELWKNKLDEILKSVDTYLKDNLTDYDSSDKTKFLKNLSGLAKIKDMHGSYEEKFQTALKAIDNYTSEYNVAKIADPLQEIKGHLDNYIDKYDKGANGLYLKVLNKLDIKTLRVKKMEFAKRYRDRIDTVLSQAGPEKKYDDQLRTTTNTFLNLFKKDHQDIYKGNEKDMKNPKCTFKQCIDQVRQPLEKLNETLSTDTPRPSMR